jgi:hypothetical protein
MTVSIPASSYLRDDLIVAHRASDAPPSAAIQGDAINAVRFLAIDAAERAFRASRYAHGAGPAHLPAVHTPFATRPEHDLSTHEIRELRQWGSRTLRQAQAAEVLSRYGNRGMGRRRPSGRETGDD